MATVSLEEALESLNMPPEEVAAMESGTPVRDKSMPDWVVIPRDLKIPHGKQLSFIKFKAEWTDTAHKGDRHIIIWPLSVSDEQMAIKRSHGDDIRAGNELPKQMIRAIDGHKADWTGMPGPGSVDLFWDEIGAKCRRELKNWFGKTHILNDKENEDFFSSCVVIRSALAT